MKPIKILLCLSILSFGIQCKAQAFIVGEDAPACKIKKTSDGDYGVGYYNTKSTGFVYIISSLKTDMQAYEYCQGLLTSGACSVCQ